MFAKSVGGESFTGLSNCEGFLFNLGIQYLHSVSDVTLEANATGFQHEAVFSSSAAPSPKEEASAETLTSALTSNKANKVGFVAVSLF